MDALDRTRRKAQLAAEIGAADQMRLQARAQARAGHAYSISQCMRLDDGSLAGQLASGICRTAADQALSSAESSIDLAFNLSKAAIAAKIALEAKGRGDAIGFKLDADLILCMDQYRKRLEEIEQMRMRGECE